MARNDICYPFRARRVPGVPLYRASPCAYDHGRGGAAAYASILIRRPARTQLVGAAARPVAVVVGGGATTAIDEAGRCNDVHGNWHAESARARPLLQPAVARERDVPLLRTPTS